MRLNNTDRRVIEMITELLCAEITVDDAQAIEFLDDWPDGTPKSFDNDFTLHWHAH